jgi:hypothetical protein
MNTTTKTECPFLKEIVMIYCDACPSRKLLPRNQVVSMGPCSTADFASCPLYGEISMGILPANGARGDRRFAGESEAKP